MQVSNPRVLGASLGIAGAMGVVGGALYALVTGRVLAHGVGAGLFVVGAIALVMGLLGATEPDSGWASRPGTQASGERRSLAARLATGHPDVERVTSASLAVWGLVVGGTLIALSMIAFLLAV